LPKSTFTDINNISFGLHKNGECVQKGNTLEMLWKIDELIAYISTFFMLKKGDLIFTGTPAGVGKMEIGDNFTGYIEDTKMFSVNVK
jgi:2-keto-4-pentenoate hydratase/2-oxohepta-3-ene-1,7-dioic acid hydratase in catechol pathway